MQPAIPQRPEDGPWMSADDVGAFDQGNQFTRWALARYIVGRVILERTSWALLVVAVVLLVAGALAQALAHLTTVLVVCVVLAVGVLLLRLLLRVILRRLMAFDVFGPVEDRVRTIVNGASRDIFAELRRVGLPGHLLTLPLIVVRLVGRRRGDTLARMKQFEVERAVPRAKRDELHMVVREATGRSRR